MDFPRASPYPCYEIRLETLVATLAKHLACLLVVPVLLLPACAHESVTVTHRPAPLPERVREDLGTIGVLPGRVTARSNYRQHEATVSSGTGDKTSGGAFAGAAVGGTGALALLPLAIVFPPMLIVAGGVFLVSTAGGAAVGASQEAPSPDHEASMHDAERAIGDALGLHQAQADLHRRVMKAAQGLRAFELISLEEAGSSAREEALDLRVFAEAGFDTLLLANVDEVMVSAEESANPVLAIDMVVTSTLLSAARGGPIDERTFACRAGKRPVRAWREDGDRSFREAVSRCYERVADRIIEELFLVYAPPDGSMPRFGGRGSARVDVEAGHPTFRWEAFRVDDARGARVVNEAVRPHDITYDLRIWRAEDGFPGDLVYARTALREPVHTLEEPLDPSTLHFWTVRARFRLNGRTRVTPWAVVADRRGYSPARLDRVTNDFYYRFISPAASGAHGPEPLAPS